MRALGVGIGMIAASSLGACAGEPAPLDRRPELVDPFESPESEGQGEALERFSGRIKFPVAYLDRRAIGPSPLEPARGEDEGEAVIVEFEAVGLHGAEGRLGLLPPRAAGRQEVGTEEQAQPADPRARWMDIEIAGNGPQRFELPAPGEGWHAPSAVVVLELHYGDQPLRALSGPRSEMLSDRPRSLGGRVILGVVPVERRPTRVSAAGLARPGMIALDGRLDEAVWAEDRARALVLSRDGEPATQLDARLGGPTRVWFAWDAEQLYVAASLPDPDLHAPHHERDDPLYREEAFEVFFAGDGSGARYLEHQVSARGVHFDARFPTYRKGDERWNGRWRSAVTLDGELDDRGGDRGWTVELAFPWSELCAETEIQCPPQPGQVLRSNVFRLDKPDRSSQVGLALSPTIQPDFHAWQNAAELVLGAPGAS